MVNPKIKCFYRTFRRNVSLGSKSKAQKRILQKLVITHYKKIYHLCTAKYHDNFWLNQKLSSKLFS